MAVGDDFQVFQRDCWLTLTMYGSGKSHKVCFMKALIK